MTMARWESFKKGMDPDEQPDMCPECGGKVAALWSNGRFTRHGCVECDWLREPLTERRVAVASDSVNAQPGKGKGE